MLCSLPSCSCRAGRPRARATGLPSYLLILRRRAGQLPRQHRCDHQLRHEMVRRRRRLVHGRRPRRAGKGKRPQPGNYFQTWPFFFLVCVFGRDARWPTASATGASGAHSFQSLRRDGRAKVTAIDANSTRSWRGCGAVGREGGKRRAGVLQRPRHLQHSQARLHSSARRTSSNGTGVTSSVALIDPQLETRRGRDMMASTT